MCLAFYVLCRDLQEIDSAYSPLKDKSIRFKKLFVDSRSTMYITANSETNLRPRTCSDLKDIRGNNIKYSLVV